MIIFASFGNLFAKDINIFGMENQTDVYEYVDSLYDAEPNAETLGGYNSIWITAPVSYTHLTLPTILLV